MRTTSISDFDAGRLSRKNLLLIFQDAVDRGDAVERQGEAGGGIGRERPVALDFWAGSGRTP